jgi:integral membrane protein (TIGR00529 family)
MDTARLLLVLVGIVIALRRKIPVGVTLFAAGLLTALLYQVSVPQLWHGYLGLVTSIRFLSLTGVIIFVTILGQLLKSLGYLERLSSAFRGLWGGNRTAAMVLPPVVGLMPMPGGALLSAPLVEQAMSDRKYPAELKTATNYWFRHLVEFSWPVYPGLVLSEAITHVPIAQVALMQLPLSIAMMVIGYFCFARQIESGAGERIRFKQIAAGFFGAIWPIGAAILIYGIVRCDLSIAVLASLILLIAAARPKRQFLMDALREGLSYKLVLMVFGILSFQTVLELSGAINSIPTLAATFHLPPPVIIFLVCFTVGILTGMTAAYVGLGYTLLAGFIYQPTLHPGYMVLAYTSGYIGMMLAPTHLCLILTNQYFQSDLAGVYKRIIPAMALLAIIGGLLAMSPWPGLIVR